MTDANPTPPEPKDGDTPNPEAPLSNERTQEVVPPPNPAPEAEPVVDYKEKFAESSKEALRLLDENKAKDAEIERLRLLAEQGNSEALYPGFEELDPEAQRNLIEYTNAIKSDVRKDLENDPAISHARQVYAEKKFDEAFQAVSTEFPDLVASREDFKAKYFQPNNTPDNLEDILKDVAKVYLFDKARDLGAADERERAARIDQERAHGGPTAPSTSRTLEEWQHLQQTNPAAFARLHKEYQADLEAGKLEE